jgi:hypothetical protein
MFIIVTSKENKNIDQVNMKQNYNKEFDESGTIHVLLYVLFFGEFYLLSLFITY